MIARAAMSALFNAITWFVYQHTRPARWDASFEFALDAMLAIAFVSGVAFGAFVAMEIRKRWARQW